MKKFLHFLYLIWFVLYFLVLFFISMPLLLISTLLSPIASERLVYFTIRQYCILLMLGIGVRKKIYNAPSGISKAVYLPNHNSYFDPISTYLSIDQPFKSLAKIELGRIPLFGFLIRRTCVLVDRKDIKSRMASLEKMSEYLNIVNLVLYPQGGIDEENLFTPKVYSGGFHIAKNAGTDIYPCILLDNMKRLPPDSVWKVSPGPMRIIYLDPIPKEYIQKRETKALMQDYCDYMLACIDQAQENGAETVAEFSRKWWATHSASVESELSLEI